MKKSFIMKTIVVILLAFLAIFLAGCTTGNDYIYTTIEASEDGRSITLTSPDEEETRVYLYVDRVCGTLYGKLFLYENFVTYDDGTVADVYSPVDAREVLYVSSYGEVFCYVEKNASDSLSQMQRFFSGEFSRVTLAQTNAQMECVLTDAEAERLFSATREESLIEVDVRNLKNKLYFDVIAYDGNLALTQKMGAIFKLDEQYLFVDFSTLENSAFDANGDLSYRNGTIRVERIEGEKLNLFESVLGRKKFLEQTVTYETGLYVGEEIEEEDSLSVLWILILLFTLTVPAVPVIYLVRFLIKRHRLCLEGGKKIAIPIPILVMVAGGALWVLAGISLLCILVFL